MKAFLLVAVALSLSGLAQAASIFPDTLGTRWEYRLIDSSASTAEPQVITVVAAGNERINGKNTLRLETRAGDALQKTEFIVIDETGVACLRRTSADGKSINFEPPQRWLPAALKFGVQWKLDDEIEGHEIQQQFAVKVEEDMVVPAGTFHAFLCESEEPWPISIAVQRWFSPGVGAVKEITTTRGPTGRLLSRKTMALQKFSRGSGSPNETPTPSPSPSAAPEPVKFTLIAARERDGEFETEFRSNAPNIFVRWTAQNLPVGGHVRVAWVVDDVGDVAEPNFVIDEVTTTVTQAESGAQFTLSRPKDGWAAGKYRVELYLNDELLDTTNVTIRD